MANRHGKHAREMFMDEMAKKMGTHILMVAFWKDENGDTVYSLYV